MTNRWLSANINLASVKKNIFVLVQNIIRHDAPSGSGIDYEYKKIRISRYHHGEKKILFENSYHYMNENGFYDGIFPFTVIINKNSDVIVKFHVNSAGRYRVNKNDIKNYLEELFTYWAMENENILKEFF